MQQPIPGRTSVVAEAIKLEKAAFWARLAQRTPDSADRYREAKKAAATSVAEAKAGAVWGQFGEALGRDS